MSDVPQCPACSGGLMLGHPAGWLSLAHVDPCALRDAEDARLMADREAGSHTREATPTERTLLTALGLQLPPTLRTGVRWLTPGVRHRRWPALLPQVRGRR